MNLGKALRLAKPYIDVGLFTNNLGPMLSFWQDEIGLRPDHDISVGSGVRQYRHVLAGSVLKINHARDILSAQVAGYRELIIAQDGIEHECLKRDPDGNAVRLVPSGTFGVTQIGIRVAASNVQAHVRFYCDVLKLQRLPGNDFAFALGESIIIVDSDGTVEVGVPLLGKGLRYLTIQVFDTDITHEGIVGRGGTEGRKPVTLGDVARISMVRDPDGNWIELSQRREFTKLSQSS